MIPDDLQAGQSAVRAGLECRVVATERRVKVVDRNREWSGSVSGTTLCDIGDRCLRHNPFLLIPKRLQAVIHSQLAQNPSNIQRGYVFR